MILGLSLILKLLLWLAASFGAYMSEAKYSSSSLGCIDIPYPFGKSGEAMNKQFEISCQSDDAAPLLQLGGTSMYYEVESISLQGHLSIYTGAIAVDCPPNFTRESGWIDLEGTPYTISDTKSSGNMLTIIGCENVAVILGPDGISASTCVTFCNSSIAFATEEISNGSCSSTGGCCQAFIPKGLKRFNFTLQSIQTAYKGLGQPSCSQAFFVNQSSFKFSTDMLLALMQDEPISQDRYLVTLDWAIGNETCEEARLKDETYACKKNSYCYTSANGVGYRCNCSLGYDGNPYAADGCTDINECMDPQLNPCVGLCINEPGSVSCACPHGQLGDGRKQGSGCRNMVPLELSLGNTFKFAY
ncbi:wall-associated receptor kinase 1 [Cocos nucifera]|uniref:Wall-associated receptor kinase 1 n=1 Tax=Cocos nucifera TaxID=13894 RepID=A0A8K0IG60_COCNU|nr:wall-associated receptor kinase 1 [Cocos nucifera]